MEAYYIHDSQKENDLIVLPQSGCSVTVNTQRLHEFIGVKPNFSQWTGDTCGDLAPEDFGVVVATRSEEGDVCVLKQDLWRQRMAHYLD